MNNRNTVNLITNDGENKVVQLLCAFEMEEYDNKYIIYTKNEQDDEGHTIIYAGALLEKDGIDYLVNIETDEEWMKIKDVIKNMARYGKAGEI